MILSGFKINTMKNRIIKIIIFFSIILLSVMIYLHSYVNGDKISKFLLDERIVEIHIKETYETGNGSEKIYETYLDEVQKQELVSLLNKTSFEKIRNHYYPYSEHERYLCTAYDINENEILRLESYGGEFIIFDWRSDEGEETVHLRLKINNKVWKGELEKIIKPVN